MTIRPQPARTRVRAAALAALVVLPLGGRAVAARDVRVGTDAATIQAAIDAATDGDRVVVPAGVYRERIVFHGKAVTVVAEDGPAATAIDAGGYGTPVSFTDREGPGSGLEGFTVRGGASTYYAQDGGGISTYFASPTIRGNRIVLNAGLWGGGIRVYGGEPRIEGNEIAFNRSSNTGGGIGVIGAASSLIEIVGNRVHDNAASSEGGGIYLTSGGTYRVTANTIVSNRSSGGGGISAYSLDTVEIVGNLVADNRADEGSLVGTNVNAGGGIRCVSVSSVVLAHDTVAGNSGGPGSAVWLENNLWDATIVSNVLTGARGGPAFAVPTASGLARRTFALRSNLVDAGGDAPYAGDVGDRTGIDGNLTGDPRFAGAAIGDFALAPDSPATDSGETTQWTPATDVLGGPRATDGDGDGAARIDAGAIESGGGPVVFWFDTGDVEVAETVGTVDVGVCRSGTAAASVLVRGESGGARLGADYDLLDPLVQFAPGETRRVVTLRIRPDGFYEGSVPEPIFLTLAPQTAGAKVGARALACVDIVDSPATVAAYLPLQPGMTSRFDAASGAHLSAAVASRAVLVRGTKTRVIRWSYGESWNVTCDDDGLRLHRMSSVVGIPGIGRQRVTFTFDPPVVLAAGHPLVTTVASATGIVVTNPIGDRGVLRVRYSSTFTASTLPATTVPLGTFDAIRVAGNLVVNGVQEKLTLDLAPGLGLVRFAVDDGAGGDPAGIVSTDLGRHALEVQRVVVPGSVRLRPSAASAVARVNVRIRNPGDRAEVIEDAAMLDALLSVDVASLGAAPAPSAVRAGPKVFPIVLAPRAVVAIPFDVRIAGANDPARGPGHGDFVVGAALDLSALDRFERADPYVPPAPAPQVEATLDVLRK